MFYSFHHHFNFFLTSNGSQQLYHDTHLPTIPKITPIVNCNPTNTLQVTVSYHTSVKFELRAYSFHANPMTANAEQQKLVLRSSIRLDKLHHLSAESYAATPRNIFNKPVKFDAYLYDDWQRQGEPLLIDIAYVKSKLFEVKKVAEDCRRKFDHIRMDQEGQQWKPTFYKIMETYLALWKSCAYQYGRNELVDCLCIGFIYADLHFLLMLTLAIPLVILTFPFAAIYDRMQGRTKALFDWARQRFTESDVVELDSEGTAQVIMHRLQSLAADLHQKYPNYVVSTVRDVCSSVVEDSTSDGITRKMHYYDRFSIAFKTSSTFEEVRPDAIALTIASSTGPDSVSETTGLTAPADKQSAPWVQSSVL